MADLGSSFGNPDIHQKVMNSLSAFIAISKKNGAFSAPST